MAWSSRRVRGRRGRARGALAACAAVVIGTTSPVLRAQSPELAALLARPVSPGSLARLIEHAASPQAQMRLAEALEDSRPEVRAAAARVIFAGGMMGLVPSMAVALEVETAHDAVVELSRGLVQLGGPRYDDRVLAAWDRIPSREVPLTLAAARGTASLSLLPRFRARDESMSLVPALERATRADRARLSDVIASALRDRDSELVGAALDVARQSGTMIADAPLVAALQPELGREIRTAALWYLLRVRDPEPPVLSAGVTDAAAALVRSTGADPSDPQLFVALELISRVADARRSNPEWRALLADPPAAVRTYLALRGIQALLTAEERGMVDRDRNRDVPAAVRQVADLLQSPMPVVDSSTALRTASGYPSGFVAAVFNEGGCKVSSARNAGSGGGAALLTLRADGRIARVSLVDTGVPKSCADSVRALLMTYADPLDQAVREGDQALVVIPFLPDFVACQSEPAGPGAKAAAIGPGRRIDPPKKIRDVRPKYPDSAQRNRVQGIVVLEASLTAGGCVRTARVTRPVDPRLDWAAMIAVLQWKFSPVLLGGVPTPFIMNVTVNFTLFD